jgi:ketosteroid isomerase-like protein
MGTPVTPEGRNVNVYVFLAAFLIAGLPSAWAACPGHSRDEQALLQLEHNWAKALEQHDTETVACLLADEFQDADVDGQVHDRNEALARVAKRRPSTNQLEDMHAHLYGDTAFVRGLNQVRDAAGKVLARVRFTDIFVYRDGRWQAVAGHETLVSEKAP